jgi:membrane protein YqaA with SNARE-associated domain
MHDFVVWLQETLVPLLGPGGMLVVAFVDSSFLSIPEVNDVFVVTSSAARPERAWLYVLVTVLGSVGGCSALWLVGKRGGEPLLVRKFGKERVESTRVAFRRWDLLALAIPALLPPPMPFKVFVFSAGVFGVPYYRFVATVGLARGVRYSAWGILGSLYGVRAMDYLKAFDLWFQANAVILLPVFLVVVLIGLLLAWRRQGSPRPSA